MKRCFSPIKAQQAPCPRMARQTDESPGGLVQTALKTAQLRKLVASVPTAQASSTVRMALIQLANRLARSQAKRLDRTMRGGRRGSSNVSAIGSALHQRHFRVVPIHQGGDR